MTRNCEFLFAAFRGCLVKVALYRGLTVLVCIITNFVWYLQTHFLPGLLFHYKNQMVYAVGENNHRFSFILRRSQ